MEELKIKSASELYKKLLPALSTKVADLKRHNIKHIKEDDIWQYLKKHYWVNSKELSLSEVVNDILSTPNDELINYVSENKKEVKQTGDGLL